MRSGARYAVDALNLQAEQINGLDALVYHHRHGGSISPEQVFQTNTEDGIDRRRRARVMHRGAVVCNAAGLLYLSSRSEHRDSESVERRQKRRSGMVVAIGMVAAAECS
jgi:hypothetical protein